MTTTVSSQIDDLIVTLENNTTQETNVIMVVSIIYWMINLIYQFIVYRMNVMYYQQMCTQHII